MSALSDPEDDRPLRLIVPPRVDPEAVTLSPPRLPAEFEETQPSSSGPPTLPPNHMTEHQADQLLALLREIKDGVAAVESELTKMLHPEVRS